MITQEVELIIVPFKHSTSTKIHVVPNRTSWKPIWLQINQDLTKNNMLSVHCELLNCSGQVREISTLPYNELLAFKDMYYDHLGS